MKTVVMGAQWGDEGKGKIVDFLAEDVDVVVRYSGGANAGHTVVVNDNTFKLHLVPSGIIHPDKQVVLGIGMVIDPQALFEELGVLEEQGVTWEGRVFIADRAHLVLPHYKQLDREMDEKRAVPIGTTGRGIGICYALKAYRDGIRVVDMFDEQVNDRLAAESKSFLKPYRDRLQAMMTDVSAFLHERTDKEILFEGAQGTLLDPDIGTYPYVSSGLSSASGAAIGGGIGPKDLDKIIGVCKAYTTRVGNGPLPTEFTTERDGDLGERIRELGREYGVTTGRPRRCGFLDLVALRYACRTNSIDSLALTHLDVYDEMAQIQVGTAYQMDGGQTRDFPASVSALQSAQPVIETVKGWQRPIGACRRFDELPDEAKQFVCLVEEYTGTPVEFVSVGYRREETIVREPRG